METNVYISNNIQINGASYKKGSLIVSRLPKGDIMPDTPISVKIYKAGNYKLLAGMSDEDIKVFSEDYPAGEIFTAANYDDLKSLFFDDNAGGGSGTPSESPVQDVTVNGTSVLNHLTKKAEVLVPVLDVTVNDVSVVDPETKTAKITIPPPTPSE